MRGVFIAVEGIDGCGKGTIIKRLAQDLFDHDKNNHIFLTREPYDRNWLDRYLSQPNVSKRGEEALRLFVEDRANHCKIIKHFLADHIVLTDRFKHSTYAYQMAQGMDYDVIHELHQPLLVPDLTIILDVPAKEAVRRSQGRGSTDQFEQEKFLQQVRENYLKLKRRLSENILIVDGNREKDDVYTDVKKAVFDFLEMRKTL